MAAEARFYGRKIVVGCHQGCNIGSTKDQRSPYFGFRRCIQDSRSSNGRYSPDTKEQNLDATSVLISRGVCLMPPTAEQLSAYFDSSSVKWLNALMLQQRIFIPSRRQ